MTAQLSREGVESSSSDKRFVIRSELMDGYLPEQALFRDGEIRAVRDGLGRVQLFSLGTDALFNYRPDPGAPTGWAVHRIELPEGLSAVHLAAGCDNDGRIYIFVADAKTIWWRSDAPWSDWTRLVSPFSLTANTTYGANSTIAGLRTGQGADGRLLLSAGWSAIAGYTAKQPAGTTLTSVDWRRPEAAFEYQSMALNTIHDWLPAQSELGSGVWVSATDPVGNDLLLFFGEEQELLGSWHVSKGSAARLTGAVDGVGVTQILTLSTTGQIGYFQGGDIEPIPYVGDPVEFVAFAAGIRAAALQPVFVVGAIDSQGSFYQAHQYLEDPRNIAAPAGRAWVGFLDLEADLQPQAELMSVAVDGQGVTHFFASSTDSKLVDLSQNQSDEWSVERVAAELPEGSVETRSCYATDVGVTDAVGNAIPGLTLTLNLTRSARILVNGETVDVGPERGVVAQTNAAGRVNLVIPTDSLGVPSVRVSAGFLPSADTLDIQPDRYIQDQLHPDTAAELATTLSEASVDGTPLVPSQFDDDVDAVANGIWQSMTLAQPEGGAELDSERRARPHLLGGSDRAGVHRNNGFCPAPDTLRPSAIPDQAWCLDFRGGRARFHSFADGEAMRAWLDPEAPELELAALFSLHKPDWGSLWRKIKHGAAAIRQDFYLAVETVDSLVHEGVEYGRRVLVTIEGIAGQTFQYIVGTVQQCFDMVEGVFEMIEVGFERLYDWLATLFDWQGILAVQGQIVSAVEAGFQTAFDDLAQLQGSIDAALDGLIAQLDKSVLGGGASPYAQRAEAVESTDQAPGPSTNWAQDHVLNGGGGSPAPGGAEATSSGESDQATSFLSTAWDSLGADASQLIVDLRDLLASGADPGGWTFDVIKPKLTALLADLVGALKDVVDLGFALIEDILADIQALLEREWHIPILSSLWRDLTGTELSLLNLIALVIAVPTHVGLAAVGLEAQAELTAAEALALVEASTVAQVAFTFANLIKVGFDVAGTFGFREFGYWPDLSAAAGLVSWTLAASFPANEPFEEAQGWADAAWATSGFMLLVSYVMAVGVRKFKAASVGPVPELEGEPDETTPLLSGGANPAEDALNRVKLITDGVNTVMGVAWAAIFTCGTIAELDAHQSGDEGGKSEAAIWMRWSRNMCRCAAPILAPMRDLGPTTRTAWAIIAGVAGDGVAVLTWLLLDLGGQSSERAALTESTS